LTLFRLRLTLLIAVLAGLLVWVLVNDRSSPNHPHGEFGGLLLWAALVVGVAGGVIALVRAVPGFGKRSRPDEGDGEDIDGQTN
jgi:hypothetical protein